MDVRQGVLLCLLLLGFSQTNAQSSRDARNIVFAPPRAKTNSPISAQRPQESNIVYAPQGALRPKASTDGAIYQKTVNGVSFKIVSMCQEFDTVFKPGLMEFDTLQGGCRFVITFDKNLPSSQTVYTPSSVYSASSAVNPYHQNQAAERRREYFNQPPLDAPPAQPRYVKPAPAPVVRERVYPERQQYPLPSREPPARTQRYPLRTAARPPPPREPQYTPRVAPPTQSRAPAPPPRTQQYAPQQHQRAQPRYEVRSPISSQSGPQYRGSPPDAPAYQSNPNTRPAARPPAARPPAARPTADPKRLDRFQLEALGIGTLHGPATRPPGPSDVPIPRV